MYVTRRFLRSTMTPDAPLDELDESSGAPESSSRRRASPSAKRKSDAADAMPAERVASASVGPSRTSASKKKASPRMSRAIAAAAELQAADADVKQQQQKPALQFAGYGMFVDAHDSRERWSEAKIVGLNAAEQKVFVHYVGWNTRYDAWVSVAFLAAHGSHTGAEKKSAAGARSWNGTTPLFASTEDAVESDLEQLRLEQQQEEDVAETVESAEKKLKKAKKKMKKEKKAKKKKKREDAQACLSKKRCSRVDDSARTLGVEEDGEEIAAPDEAAQLPPTPKRVRRATGKTKTEVETLDEAAPPKPKRHKSARVQPVRVAVATTDEASERKARRSRKQPVDMELDMDVRDDNASEASTPVVDEAQEDIEVDDEGTGKRGGKKAVVKKPRGKAKRGGAMEASNAPADSRTDGLHSENATNTGDEAAVAPLPAAPKRGGGRRQKSTQQRHQPPRAPVVLSETREKLAAIFRLRLQQRQQLEQLMQSDSSLDASSLQDEVRQASVIGNGGSAKPPAPASSSDATSSAETAALEAFINYSHARQIQQYYYQQAVLRANLMDSGGGGAPQGGIIDPRIINAGVDALVEQQQQYQDYVQRMAITRERNMQALAANKEFLAKSGQAWQHQQADDEAAGGNPQAPAMAAEASGEAAASSKNAADGSSSSASPVKSEALGVGISAAASEAEKGGVLYEFVL